MSVPIHICRFAATEKDKFAFERLVQDLVTNYKAHAFTLCGCPHQPMCEIPPQDKFIALVERVEAQVMLRLQAQADPVGYMPGEPEIDLMSNVGLASEIEPALAEAMVDKKVVRMEWHDGHGDHLLIHLEDGTRLGIRAGEGSGDLVLRLIKPVSKAGDVIEKFRAIARRDTKVPHRLRRNP